MGSFVLPGCSARLDEPVPLLFAAMALLLVAVCAFASGHFRAHHRHSRQLRTEREQLRALQALQGLQNGWLWETDAAHRGRRWRSPQLGEGPADALFSLAGDDNSGRLLARLRAELPFHGLRLATARPLEGRQSWLLDGVPCRDEAGRFSGFIGHARPLDEEDTQRIEAAMLHSILQTQAAAGMACLLLWDRGQGWQVKQLNSAAARQWPELKSDTAVRPDDLFTKAVLDALDKPLPTGASALVEVEGWSLCRPMLAAGEPIAAAPGTRAAVLARRLSADAETQAPAEVDAFSFTLSHDLRAPIRVVEGFTRIVKEDYGKLLDRVGNDHLDRVLGAAARMNLMIDALLTLARLSTQPLARQPVDLSQLAGYVMDELQRHAPERQLEWDIQPGLLAVGDPTLLRLVLENLLGNAWKYSARCAKAHISLHSEIHARGVTYVVRDNGAGFDMRSADRLFGLFQRLHSASEFAGHGVGLASVRRIVRRHGGEIWAEGEPGRGAAFFFTLAA